MVVQLDPPVAAERVQLVVLQLRIAASAHLHRAAVAQVARHVDAVGVQAAGEHPQVEGGVVGEQDPA